MVGKVTIPHTTFYENNNLVITLNSLKNNNLAAFFLYKNGEKVRHQWYGRKKICEFDLSDEFGIFHAGIYLKNLDDNSIIYQKTRYFFINPRIIKDNYADLNSIGYYKFVARDELDCLFFPSDQKKLFVLLPSASPVAKRESPLIFHRWLWALSGHFPGNVLACADPTIMAHPNLNVAWFYGSPTRDAIKDLGETVKEIAESRGIESQNIVTYGSSSGGFASLALSSYLENSTAIAINPQTTVQGYGRKEDVENLEKAMKEEGNATGLDWESPRLDMLARYAGNVNNKIIMVINRLDLQHFRYHVAPFMQKFWSFPQKDGWHNLNNCKLCIYSSPQGHAPETREMSKEIIRRLI